MSTAAGVAGDAGCSPRDCGPARRDLGTHDQQSESRLFIVANRQHAPARRRSSFAREYAHVLFDRRRKGIVTRASDKDELVEVRANAFAARPS